MRGSGGAACIKDAVPDLITQLVRGASGAACKGAVLDLIIKLERGACGAACKYAVLDLITQLVRGPCGAACKGALLNPAAMKSVLGAGLMHPWSSAGLKKMQSRP